MSKDSLKTSSEDLVETSREFLHDLITDAKPKLRGWLHVATVPVVLIAGLMLTALAPTAGARLGAAIYTFTALLLFSVSAVYHRGNGWWPRRTHLMLARLDHSNIFLLIGGSITPFAIILLDGLPRILLLTIMWIGVLVGVLLKVCWASMPRKVSTSLYIGLGWTPIAFIGEFAEGLEPLAGRGAFALTLIAVGGLLYTVGGLIYGFKALNTWPKVWGFHEWFHLCTVTAFICHYSAIALVSFTL